MTLSHRFFWLSCSTWHYLGQFKGHGHKQSSRSQGKNSSANAGMADRGWFQLDSQSIFLAEKNVAKGDGVANLSDGFPVRCLPSWVAEGQHRGPILAWFSFRIGWNGVEQVTTTKSRAELSNRQSIITCAYRARARLLSPRELQRFHQ